jgi:hypothetical protein
VGLCDFESIDCFNPSRTIFIEPENIKLDHLAAIRHRMLSKVRASAGLRFPQGLQRLRLPLTRSVTSIDFQRSVDSPTAPIELSAPTEPASVSSPIKKSSVSVCHMTKVISDFDLTSIPSLTKEAYYGTIAWSASDRPGLGVPSFCASAVAFQR